MVRRLFLREISDSARLPIQNRYVGCGSSFWFVADREEFAVVRPDRTRLRNVRRTRQVHYFAAVARNRIEIVDFAATFVGLEDDPLPIRRPDRARLPIVRLAQLDRPSAIGIHLPEIVAAREVGRKDNLFAIGRPCASADRACEEQIVDGNWICALNGGRCDRFRVGNLAGIGRVSG